MPYKDKQKQLEYQRNWLRERRKNFFKDKFCEKCGSTEKLELHHLDKNKKEGHRIWSWSKERQKKELVKCVIWCQKCHTEHHAKEKTKTTHGRYIMYSRKGCRCDICRKWKADSDKKYRGK